MSRRIDHYEPQEQEWTQTVIEDRTAGPADIARTRIDFADWLDSLKRRDRRVAEFLAKGETTKTAAKRFKVSAGRISPVAARTCRQLACVPRRRPRPCRCHRGLIPLSLAGIHAAPQPSPGSFLSSERQGWALFSFLWSCIDEAFVTPCVDHHQASGRSRPTR